MLTHKKLEKRLFHLVLSGRCAFSFHFLKGPRNRLYYHSNTIPYPLSTREHSHFNRNKQYSQLGSFPFLVALLVLLLNDFYLKAEFHNWFTGKLSDVAGLFIFPFFWSVLLPRHRLKLYWGTALLFILWKSPFSEGFIQLFSHYLYPIDRVVDVSDLLALAILPLAYWLSKQEQVPKLRINPAFIGILSFFSFCATSIMEPTQYFEQPQYVLLKPIDLKLDGYDNSTHLTINRTDSLLIIEVPYISLTKEPFRSDDYHKTFVQRDLIPRVLKELRVLETRQLEDYIPLANSLIVSGAVTISLPSEYYTDSLSFKDSRLHGNFLRLSPSGKELIRGQYVNGIEDSLWFYYNEHGALIEKKLFREGEMVRSEEYHSWKPVKITNVKTRAEVVTAKQFHLAILIVLAVGVILYLIRWHRTPGERELFQTHTGKIGYSLLMGFLALLLSELIALAMVDFYRYPFFTIFGKFIFGFFLVSAAFLILFYAVRIRKAKVLFAYVVLFALLIVILEEGNYLKQLLADPI